MKTQPAINVNALRRALIAAAVLAVASSAASQEKPLISDYARAAIGSPPQSLGVDAFYTKYVDALGRAILSSGKTPDWALLVARDSVISMLAKRPDLRAEMVRKRMRVGVMAQSESTTDIPEHRNNKK